MPVPPAHTSGDEHHLGAIVEHLADVFNAFFGGFAGLCRDVSRAESFFSELETNGNGRVHQCFAIGVAKYEIDIVNTLTVHVVDGISATASNADDLND